MESSKPDKKDEISSFKNQADFVELRTHTNPKVPFTHKTMEVRKKPKDESRKEDPKHQYKWYQKEKESARDALLEVLSQEFFRLLIPNQPKTRISKNKANKFYVISREITGYQFDIQDQFAKNIKSRNYKGLGEVTVVSKFLGERDLKFGNVGINHENEVLKIDGDHCLTNLLPQNEIPLSEFGISEFPFPGSYNVHNWLGVVLGKERQELPNIIDDEISTLRDFRREVNRGLLKLILLPDSLIRKFLHRYFVNLSPEENLEELENQIYDSLIRRKRLVKHDALQDISFQNYMQSNDAKEDLKKYLTDLKKFKTTQKNYLLDAKEGQDLERLLNSEFKALSGDAQFEYEATRSEASRGKNKINDRGTSQLHLAAACGDIELVQSFLNGGVDCNVARKGDGCKPIHLAVINGQLDMVKFLLVNNVDINSTNRYGKSLLAYAIEYGHTAIIKYLLNNGADVNKADQFKVTPIQLATLYGRLEIVKSLLKEGADVNLADMQNSTPLYIAARQGNLEIVKLLGSKGAQVDGGSNVNFTPLMVAAEYGYCEVAKYLLEKGASVNIAGYRGLTALYMAAQNGHYEMVKFLLEKGADVNAVRDSGETPIFIAAGQGHLNIVQLLLEKGANLEMRKIDGSSPLQSAALHGHLEVMKFLIEKGLKANEPNKYGATPIFSAAERGHIKALNFLLENGCHVNEKRTDNNATPLFVAAQENYFEAVRFLLKKGADPSIPLQITRKQFFDFCKFRNCVQTANTWLFKNPPDLFNNVALKPFDIAQILGNVGISRLLYLSEAVSNSNKNEKNPQSIARELCYEKALNDPDLAMAQQQLDSFFLLDTASEDILKLCDSHQIVTKPELIENLRKAVNQSYEEYSRNKPISKILQELGVIISFLSMNLEKTQSYGLFPMPNPFYVELQNIISTIDKSQQNQSKLEAKI